MADPRVAIGISICRQALRTHGDAVTRRRGRHVAAVANDDRVEEMLVQMIDILDDTIVERSADADVIEHREVLHVLAQSDAAGVRTARNYKSGREQDDGQHLIDAAQAAAVDLTKTDRAGLHQLLEHDAVLALLACGNTNRGDGARDRRMPEDVVGTRWFLDPPGIEPRELLHVRDRLVDVPHLIRVHHQLALRTDFLANDCRAPNIVGEIASYFDLEVGPTLGHPFAAQTANLGVRISEPTGRRRVRRIADALKFLLASRF